MNELITLFIKLLFGGISSGDIAENGRTGSRFEALEFANLENEVRGTLALAKASVRSGVSIDRVVIACRDVKAYVRPLMSAGREYGLPVSFGLPAGSPRRNRLR